MSPSEWFGKNERFDRLHRFCKEHSLWDDYFPSNRIKELTSDFKDSQLLQRSFSSTQVKFGNFCREALARRKSSLETSAEKFGNFCREVWELLQRSLETSIKKFRNLTGGFGKIHRRI